MASGTITNPLKTTKTEDTTNGITWYRKDDMVFVNVTAIDLTPRTLNTSLPLSKNDKFTIIPLIYGTQYAGYLQCHQGAWTVVKTSSAANGYGSGVYLAQ